MMHLRSRLVGLARSAATKSPSVNTTVGDVAATGKTSLPSIRLFSSNPFANHVLGSDSCCCSSCCGTPVDVKNVSLEQCFHEELSYQKNGSVLVPSSYGSLSHNSSIHQAGLGRRAAPVHVAKPGPTGSMLLSNNYASSNRFEEKAKIRALMESRGLKKEPGWSRIEIQGQLNTFLVDDRSHPRNAEIRAELQKMLLLMREEGYVADIRCVLRDIPDSEKENALQHHSERLAMALGHISLPPRAPLRVIKNLRVCNDCHVATKYFAYIYKREIIVRDATRFHHFRDGYCSCGDYW